MAEFDERVQKEIDNIKDSLNDLSVNPKRIKVLNPVIVNTAWMKVKLDDAREAVKNSNIAIRYDNGGGQKGLRENPLFKGYEALWKSYMSGMGKILDAIPAEHIEVKEQETEKAKTMLQLVRERKQA